MSGKKTAPQQEGKSTGHYRIIFQKSNSVKSSVFFLGIMTHGEAFQAYQQWTVINSYDDKIKWSEVVRLVVMDKPN